MTSWVGDERLQMLWFGATIYWRNSTGWASTVVWWVGQELLTVCWRPISAPISSPSMLFDPLFLQHIGNLMNEWGWKQKYLLAWEFTHLENCRVPVWTFAWHNSQAMLNILRKKEFFNNKREGTLSPCPSSSYFCLFTCDIGQEQKCSTPHLPPKLWLEY